MRKKLTLTIEPEVYDMIKELPRKVSISEVVSFVLKAIYQDLRKGRELTQEEFDKWTDSNPELKDFRERLGEHWGPGIEKIETTIEKAKKAVKPKRKNKN